jgi:hypothetical protein
MTKNDLERELSRLRYVEQELADFKTQVREKAIEVSQEQRWCRDGLNTTLDDLGLDKVASRIRKTATIKVTYTWDPEDEENGLINDITITSNNYNDFDVEEFEVVDEGEEEEEYDD